MSAPVDPTPPQRAKRRWMAPAILIASIIAAAYLWTSYTQRFALTNEPDAAKDTGAVRIESSFSQRDLDPGEAVVLSVVINNRSPQTLSTPWVIVEVPGLVGALPSPRVEDVARGERVTVTFPLHAGSAQGQFRARVTVGWTVGNQPVVTLLTPPTIVIRGRAARATWIAAAVQSLSKDLALPIIVVILASIFKRADDLEKMAREEREKTEALAREERRRQDDRLRDTWSLLLPRHHDNATLYYLPLLGAIGQFLQTYDSFGKSRNPVDARKPFYFFLLTFWRMRRLQGNIGGLHFKNRDGEQVLADLWNQVVLQTDAAFRDRARRDVAIDSLARTDTPVSFAIYAQRLEYRAPYPELRQRFVEWQNVPDGTSVPSGTKRDRLALSEIVALLTFFHPWRSSNRIGPTSTGTAKSLISRARPWRSSGTARCTRLRCSRNYRSIWTVT